MRRTGLGGNGRGRTLIRPDYYSDRGSARRRGLASDGELRARAARGRTDRIVRARIRRALGEPEPTAEQMTIAEAVTMPFGPHCGHTLGEIFDRSPQYLLRLWGMALRNRSLAESIAVVCAGRMAREADRRGPFAWLNDGVEEDQ